MRQMWRGDGPCPRATICMNKLRASFSVLLVAAGGVASWGFAQTQSDQVEEVLKNNRLRFIGVFVPLHTPPGVQFDFAAGAARLKVIPEIRKAATEDGIGGGDGVNYWIRLNSDAVAVGRNSPLSAALMARLSEVVKSGDLLEAELRDTEYLSECLAAGESISSAKLISINDAQSGWARHIRSGDDKIIRLRKKNDIWEFTGELGLWRVKASGAGGELLIKSGAGGGHAFLPDSPGARLIVTVLDRLSADIKHREDYIFGADAVKFYGDMDAEECLREIHELRTWLVGSK